MNEKQIAVMKMCEQYYSLQADSLLKYIQLGIEIIPNSSSDFLRIKNFYCSYLFKTGKTPEAVLYTDSLLRNLSSFNNTNNVELEIRANKASARVRNNENKEGIDEGLKLLELAEKIKDTAAILKSYTIIGWANMELENYPEAIKWLHKGVYYTKDESILCNASSMYNNMASSFNNINQKDSAFYYIDFGLKYGKQTENLSNTANSLNIRAAMFLRDNKIQEAEKDLEDALTLREKIGDVHYVISDMAQLASFYASIGSTNKGIAIAKKGILLALKSNNLSKLIFLNVALSENYKKANKKDEYAKTLIDIIQLKDSLYEKNSEGAIAEMVTKYELQKKENIIIQQENKLLQGRYITIGSLLALILASVIIWLVYRNYHHVQQRKMGLALAEEKLHSIKAVQLAEEKERKRIAADLHDNLGSYAAAITSNVRYLKEGTQKDTDLIIAQLEENAQGIVTQLSDTIWVLKNEQLPITKLADRFKAWAQRIIQNYPNVTYHYAEDITNDLQLTPGRILNIFLILKECLNNSLKHSNCTEVRIEIISNHQLQLSIEDNGTGFQSNLINRGNGIENIKYRAQECGMKVEWQTVHPSGIRVIISNTTTN